MLCRCWHPSSWSTVAYVFSIVLYVTVTIPSLRTVVTPLQEETKQNQVQALCVLCAGNVIIIVCLLAVLALQVQPTAAFSRLLVCLVFLHSYTCLQAGQEYAHRQDVRQFARMGKGTEAGLKKDQ